MVATVVVVVVLRALGPWGWWCFRDAVLVTCDVMRSLVRLQPLLLVAECSVFQVSLKASTLA